MEGYFASNGIAFSKECFFEQTSVDLKQLSLDAFMFGADIFPAESDQVVAA